MDRFLILLVTLLPFVGGAAALHVGIRLARASERPAALPQTALRPAGA